MRYMKMQLQNIFPKHEEPVQLGSPSSHSLSNKVCSFKDKEILSNSCQCCKGINTTHNHKKPVP